MLCCISAYSEPSGCIYLNMKVQRLMVNKKRIHYLCEGGIEKSVPRDHHLSLLAKPGDAKQW